MYLVGVQCMLFYFILDHSDQLAANGYKGRTKASYYSAIIPLKRINKFDIVFVIYIYIYMYTGKDEYI